MKIPKKKLRVWLHLKTDRGDASDNSFCRTIKYEASSLIKVSLRGQIKSLRQLYAMWGSSVITVFAYFQAGNCTLREAVILASVLAKCSIPMLHSAAAILKIAEMDYNGANSIFLKTLLDKKYALPYRVVDAVVFHFLGYVSALHPRSSFYNLFTLSSNLFLEIIDAC